MDSERLTKISTTMKDRAQKYVRKILLFPKILVLGMVVTFLAALLWTLRLLAVTTFLAGIWIAWITIEQVFAPYTATIPLLALQAIPVIGSLALLLALIAHQKQVYLWGAMITLGGLSILTRKLVLYLLPQAIIPLLLLPVALTIVFLLFTTLRGRMLRTTQVRRRKEVLPDNG